tara:strand:+ start:6963 stop:7112 length:150 start_codon:yes stop_codon:yes gene_type:complete
MIRIDEPDLGRLKILEPRDCLEIEIQIKKKGHLLLKVTYTTQPFTYSIK